MKRTERNMLQGPLAMGVLLYTLPIILTSYLQLLFNAADLVVVGRFCGSMSVAAVGVTGALTNLIVNLFMGLSVGAGVAVAHAIGSREAEVVHRTVHTALLTALVGGVVLTVVGVVFSPTFLRWMDTPENVLPLSSTYMRIYFGGITFTMVYNYCTSILRAAGDTQSPLVILMAAGVINVILNVVFVAAFHMNVAGVALATVISQAFSAVAVTAVLMRRRDDIRFYPSKMRVYWPQLKKILRIGLPAGIQGSTFSISNVIIQSAMNSFGEVLVSGNAAVSNIEGFCFATVNGFHQAAVNYIGQNVGAQQFDRVKKIFRLCVLYASLAGLLVGGALTIFRRPLLSIYITDSPEALQIGMTRVFFTSAPYFIYGLLDAAAGSLRGMGASTISMLISVLGICGSRLLWIFTVFQIPQLHTPECLYSSYPISWILTTVAEFVAFPILFRRISAKSK
ncbi:MAG: MATE family efflux transporter [Candidatus Faecousia sp.]|nr:MATE family efflux transporter [Bacillota bacterium]MDY4754519.1 MATE family efflux transporter [Candidatus Faecousia sp.]MDY6161066.1 MATE family efflux transporter [Candidatus Faecousia sp.]